MNEHDAQVIVEAMLALAITRALEIGGGSEDPHAFGRHFAYFSVIDCAKQHAELLEVSFADPAISALDPYHLLGTGQPPLFQRGAEPKHGSLGAYVVLEESLSCALDMAREARTKLPDPFEAGTLQACHELLSFAIVQARQRGLTFADRNIASLDPDELLQPAKQAA